MITCKQVYRTASDYLDTPPGLITRLMLWLHLMMCKHCRRYVRQFRLSSQASGQLVRPDEPDDNEINRLVEQLRG